MRRVQTLIDLTLAVVATLGLGSIVAGTQEGRPAETAQRSACERPWVPSRAGLERLSPQELEGARRRWEALDPESREQLAERFQRFRAMDESARRELHERAQNLERIERHLCRRLTPDEQERLDRLAPAQRAEVLRELVRGELESQGQRLVSHLPVELRERLERADGEGRLRYFQQFKAHVHERMSADAVRSLGHELGLPREEVRALLELPGPARVEAALELGKRLGRRQVEHRGLPHGLTLERWREIEALPPAEFHEAFTRHCGGLRGPEPRREGSGSLDRQLRDALRPTRWQILEHADLSREERFRAIRAEQRLVVTEVLRRSGQLDESQMAVLDAMPDGAFYTQLRRLTRERGPRPPGPPGRAHPLGPPGPGDPRESRPPRGELPWEGRPGKLRNP